VRSYTARWQLSRSYVIPVCDLELSERGITDDEVSDNRGEYIVTLSPMQTRRR
jgi:hypothetical protein